MPIGPTPYMSSSVSKCHILKYDAMMPLIVHSLVIGWMLHHLMQHPACDCPGRCQHRCRERHIISRMESTAAFEFLGEMTPYLRSPPRIIRILGSGIGMSSAVGGADVDIITIETPVNGALYDEVRTATQKLHEECGMITDIFCTRPMSSNQERGNMRNCTFGMQELGDSCTFVFLICWTSTERKMQFKDSHQPSMASRGRRLKPNWWETQVVQPFDELSSLGARVTFKTACFHHTQQDWPFEKLSDDSLDEREMPMEKEMDNGGHCFSTKHLKRSCTMM